MASLISRKAPLILTHEDLGADTRIGGGLSTDTTFSGTSGNNTITGTNNDDFFAMNDGGNDTVKGLGGNDVFTFGATLTAADKVDGGTGTDAIILSGNYSAGVTFGATTVVNVEEIDFFNNNSYKLTMNIATVSSGQTLFLNGTGLSASSVITFDASTQNAGQYKVTTGSANDVIKMGDLANIVNTAGGNDTITMVGSLKGHSTINTGDGTDTINYGAVFNASDAIDGGAGSDTLILNGNYVVSVDFTATTLVNVEKIQLTTGNSYNLRTADTTVAAGQTLFIDGSTLASGQVFNFLGVNETNGAFHLEGGAGNDVLTAGSGNDAVNGNGGNDSIAIGTGTDTANGGAGDDTFSVGANLSVGDVLDGGSGTNTMQMGGVLTLAMADNTIKNINNIALFGTGTNLNLTFADGNTAAGKALAFTDSFMVAGDKVTLDNSADTDGHLFMHLAGAETLNIKGGAGNDIIALDSNVAFTAADKFDGGGGNNSLSLQGDFTAGVALTATTLKNFQTIQLLGDHNYKLTFDNGNVAAGQTLAIQDNGNGTAATTVTMDGSADTDGQFQFAIYGSEKLVLLGGGQNDTFALHNSGFVASDKINGGGGIADKIILDGDYGAGVTFGATTLVNVEKIELGTGHNYKFTTNDATVAAGSVLVVSAEGVGAGNSVTFDGSAETDGAFNITTADSTGKITGGGGNDTIKVGTGVDTLNGGGGDDGVQFTTGAFASSDKVDGGSGFDTVAVSGNYAAGLTLTSTTLVNVELLSLDANTSYNLTMNDANVAAGQTLSVVAILNAGQSLTLDASAETDGSYFINAGNGNDFAKGGGGADTFAAEFGNDTFIGGGGDDVMLFEASFTAADTFDGGTGNDTLELQGNYLTTLGATTLTNVEKLLFDAGGFYNLAMNDANVAAGATLIVDASHLQAAFNTTFDGSAELDGKFNIIGGDGNDTLTGGQVADTIFGGHGFNTITGNNGADTIDLSLGANDVANGGGGGDTFVMGNAFNANDAIDGGNSADTLALDGNSYGGGITFGTTTVTNVENFTFGAGNSYWLTTNDFTVAAGATLAVKGSATLGAGDTLRFDGSAETDGAFNMSGGAGDDVLSGGAGADIFTMTKGGNDTVSGGDGDDIINPAATFTSADVFDGGIGTDTLMLSGNYAAGVTFGATTVTNIEEITLGAGNSYKFTSDEATVAAGATLTVDGSLLGAADKLTFTGTAETDGKFVLLGGAGADVLTGGSGIDFITGGIGADKLSAAGGADRFIYNSAADSTSAGHDTLVGFNANADKLDLDVTVTLVDAAINTGTLSTASFDSDLSAATASLGIGHAVLFTANAGDLSGHVILAVDANGVAGYQMNVDYAIDVTGLSNAAGLTAADFI